MRLDYVEHVGRESTRFLAALLTVPASAPVPSCPDWAVEDLLWHLGEVQWFWGEIGRSRALDPEPVQAAKPPRPEGREALGDFFKAASSALPAALASADPDDAVWTWSEQHTVAFVRRRQAHEALMYRIDAELTAGQRTGMDRLLSADGVDEALRVMYGDLPSWGEFTEHSDRPPSVATTDTGTAGWSPPAGSSAPSRAPAASGTPWRCGLRPPATPARPQPRSAARPPTWTAWCGTDRPIGRSTAPVNPLLSPRSTPCWPAASNSARYWMPPAVPAGGSATPGFGRA